MVCQASSMEKTIGKNILEIFWQFSEKEVPKFS